MSILGTAIKRLANKGLGQLPGVRPIYRFAWGHFGPKGISLAEVNDLKLYVACRDWAVAPTMLFAHSWEPAETEIFKRHIREGMTVIDAGAYIGYYSILASKLIGDSGKVYSFEPSPESLKLLYKNIKINNCDNIQVIEKAVSDRAGYTTFYPNPHNLSGSTMFDGYSVARNLKDPQIETPTVTLDEVVGNGKVDFIKMDIEGGETKALKGMTGIIKNNPSLKMIIEVFPAGLLRVGSSLDEFVDFLRHYFRLYVIGRNRLAEEVSLLDIQKAVKKTAIINLFCEGRKL